MPGKIKLVRLWVAATGSGSWINCSDDGPSRPHDNPPRSTKAPINCLRCLCLDNVYSYVNNKNLLVRRSRTS